MNHAHADRAQLSLVAAVPLALLLACAAGAQTPPTPVQNGETPPGQMQPRPAQSSQSPAPALAPRPGQAEMPRAATRPQSSQTSATPPARMRPQSSRPVRPVPAGSTANPAVHPRNRTRRQPGNFSALAGSKGYITQSGAASDAWLEQHFARCDTNRDGRVTRKEYEQCRKQNPPRQQP